jgi:hypothetical protein
VKDRRLLGPDAVLDPALRFTNPARPRAAEPERREVPA